MKKIDIAAAKVFGIILVHNAKAKSGMVNMIMRFLLLIPDFQKNNSLIQHQMCFEIQE